MRVAGPCVARIEKAAAFLSAPAVRRSLPFPQPSSERVQNWKTDKDTLPWVRARNGRQCEFFSGVLSAGYRQRPGLFACAGFCRDPGAAGQLQGSVVE